MVIYYLNVGIKYTRTSVYWDEKFRVNLQKNSEFGHDFSDGNFF